MAGSEHLQKIRQLSWGVPGMLWSVPTKSAPRNDDQGSSVLFVCFIGGFFRHLLWCQNQTAPRNNYETVVVVGCIWSHKWSIPTNCEVESSAFLTANGFVQHRYHSTTVAQRHYCWSKAQAQVVNWQIPTSLSPPTEQFCGPQIWLAKKSEQSQTVSGIVKASKMVALLMELLLHNLQHVKDLLYHK